MNRKLFFRVFISLFLFTNVIADNTLLIIKVNGSYAIMNKGANQGMQEGEVLYLKRRGRLEVLCKVKILRTTANRAAIEQISNKKEVALLKGDMLFLDNELKKNNIVSSSPIQKIAKTPAKEVKFNEPARERQRNYAKNNSSNSSIKVSNEQKATRTSMDVSKSSNSSFRAYSPMKHFKNPWVTIEAGSIFPNGHFSELYSNSLQFNANYMVAISDDVNLGLDISNTFLNNTDLTENFESSSMLTVAVMFQKFFGDYFFMEGGGGIFRPKVTLMSVDGIKSTYSQTNFGIVAGGGFFIPTSSYAGFIMKGKLHSYFEHYSKNYFGFTGGFRFRIR